MQSSIKLQGPFSYSIIYIIIVFTIILLFVGYRVLKWLKKRKKKVIKVKVNKPVDNVKNVAAIKKKYINQLNEIEKNVDKNNISIRHAYQSVSAIIRLFVFEVTNIKVHNYTLEEIKKLDMPNLTELIKEYYEPEFSIDSIGDIKKSIQKTRMVIEKWN